MSGCRHYKDGKCVTECHCKGTEAQCEFVIGENLGSYKFLLEKTMEFLKEFDEHQTCSLPCIYCKKYNSEKMCDGRFEWIYKDRIEKLIKE